MVKKATPPRPVKVALPAECCAKCHFFLRESPEHGLCRESPPTPINTGAQIVAFFPTMMNTGWCGKFQVAA